MSFIFPLSFKTWGSALRGWACLPSKWVSQDNWLVPRHNYSYPCRTEICIHPSWQEAFQERWFKGPFLKTKGAKIKQKGKPGARLGFRTVKRCYQWVKQNHESVPPLVRCQAVKLNLHVQLSSSLGPTTKRKSHGNQPPAHRSIWGRLHGAHPHSAQQVMETGCVQLLVEGRWSSLRDCCLVDAYNIRYQG